VESFASQFSHNQVIWLLFIFMKPVAMPKNKDKIATDPELFRDLINRSNDAIFVVDPLTGLFIFVNDKACASLGYDRRELLNRGVTDIEASLPDDFSWQAHVNELRQRGSLIFEGLHKRKNGETFPVEANISYVVLNTRTYLVTVVRDITERRRAESAMRLQGEIATNISEGIYLVSANDLRIVYANPRMEQIFGYDPGEMDGKHVSVINAPSGGNPGKTAGQIEKALKEKGSWRGEVYNVRKDGTPFWGYVSISVLQHPEYGKVYLSLQTDITESKRAEAALRAREKQLAESQRIAHIGSWEHNLKTGDVFWSDELFRLFGLDPGKDPADFKMFFEMVHPDDKPLLRKAIDETLRNKTPYGIDYRFVLKNGTTRVVHAQAELIADAAGDFVVLSGTGQDVTERKRQEQALAESEADYRNLFDSSTDGIFIIDLDGNFVDANRTAYERLGYTREEFLALNISKLDHPSFAAAVPERLRQVREFGAAVFDSGHLRKDGSVMPVEVNSRLLEYKGKQVLFSVIRDITERKQAEERLLRSEQFVRSILDTVDEGFLVIDRDFRILTVNKAYCDQVGSCDEEVTGRHCYEVSHRRSRPCYEEGEECAVRRVFATGQPHAALHKHVDRDGQLLFVETKGYPITNASGKVMSVIETINNITEKHLLEEERLRAQKLESIGTLAGGIAHDFNNLLQGIFGYISMAKISLDQREKSLAMLEQAENALHQSVSLTTQLLTFSKGGKPVRKRISLLPVIENAAKFAVSGSRSGYRLDVEPGLWQVNGDGGQLAQVIQNIVLNADQAMPEGGTIVITGRNVLKPAKEHPQIPKGNYIKISVQDSGIGIPGEYLEKIFDPYFTTKEKGSGLGLATSYSIVNNHDGIIDVVSEPGRGTTFSIYLPAAEAELETEETAPVPSSVRKGRVLVMDDEELVLGLAEELVKALGHEVELARNGAAAVEKYRAAMDSGRPFDIVILDLTIRGGMGGRDVIERLRVIDPGVVAIVSSGYSDDAVMANYHKYGFRARLTKPYKIQDLRDVLNALLGDDV
jgi:two-component system cell cycle sensor histidine kinase/response regulator CckA